MNCSKPVDIFNGETNKPEKLKILIAVMDIFNREAKQTRKSENMNCSKPGNMDNV